MSGSTALKHAVESDRPPRWLRTINDFYSDFKVEFSNFLATSEIKKAFNCQHLSPNYSLWKALGDELIFKVEISHEREPAWYVAAFSKTIMKYSCEIYEKHSYLENGNQGLRRKLGVKGTAWVAGFPVTNAVISVTYGDYERDDYIGPQMDVGFRLSKFSDRRKLIISVDLAYLLTEFVTELKFYFDGRKPLPGVLDEQPYPIIWVSYGETRFSTNFKHCESENWTDRENDLFKDCDAHNVHVVCKDFINEIKEIKSGGYWMPFIPTGDDGKENIIFPEPVEYKVEYEKVSPVWQSSEKNWENADDFMDTDHSIGKEKFQNMLNLLSSTSSALPTPTDADQSS